MTTQKTVTVTLHFNVVDENQLRTLADAAMAAHGAGIEPDGTLSQAVVELLLHSNPDIRGYLDYGIELTRTVLTDGPATAEPTPDTIV